MPFKVPNFDLIELEVKIYQVTVKLNKNLKELANLANFNF